jgi:hypothetical protein
VLENAESEGEGHRVACHFWREIAPDARDASL